MNISKEAFRTSFFCLVCDNTSFLSLLFAVCFQGAEVEPAHDFSFVVQESEALPCLDLAVTLMRRGEEAHIIADPELAYGKTQGINKKRYSTQAVATHWILQAIFVAVSLCLIWFIKLLYILVLLRIHALDM